MFELFCYESLFNNDFWVTNQWKEAKIRNRYNQEDTTWESDENKIKHPIHKSQEVSPFPAGNKKAAFTRQENMTNTKHK